jgi:O-antigen/teichoic acid export membrane protein
MTPARMLVGNAVLVLTSDVVNRAATFIVYALIARYLGATEVGQMALGLALFYAFQVFASAGVRTIITREVAKDPASLAGHLTSGTLLVCLASAASIAGLAGLVRALGYAHGTASIVLLLGIALLPSALSVVCEAVFQAFDRMRYIAYAQVPAHVARVVLTYLLLTRGHGIEEVALVLLACHGTIAAVEWWLLRQCVAQPRSTVTEPSTMSPTWTTKLTQMAAAAWALARSARTFLGIDGLIAIGASLNIVLLSALAGETEVGLYSAATQLMIPFRLVFQSIVVSAFPTLCRRFGGDTQDVTALLSRMLTLLLAVAIPATVGLFVFADSTLLLLYGERDFLQASTALRVMVWTLVPTAVTSVLGQVFLAGRRETVTLRIVLTNLIVGAAAGVVLIAQFGLIGAAVATLLTSLVNVWQHYGPVSRLVPPIAIGRLGAAIADGWARPSRRHT